MKLYASTKKSMILTPHLALQLRNLENKFGSLSDSARKISSYDREEDRQLAQLESLRELNHTMVFSDDLQWILLQAQEQHNKYIVSFDVDEHAFIKFPVVTVQDDKGNEIKTFTISAEKFGELARTSKDSEEGQNTVFQEFKEKEQKSEPQKSEGFWNKVEGLFGRGWK